MTIVDLAKARAFAASFDDGKGEVRQDAADWIRELADEVESLQRAVGMSRELAEIDLANAARLTEENEQLRAALAEICTGIAALIKDSA